MQRQGVSVVVPVFNAGQVLKESLESALSQTGCEFEVIVVDDGSSCSETREILRSFEDRVRVFHQVNSGPATARNEGVRHARYEWIAFLDQDDVWVEGKLQRQLETAARTSADVVYTNALNFGELERVSELRNDPDRMPEGDVFEILLLDNFLTMAGVMIRRKLFLDLGSFRADFAGVDDWDMWLRVAAAGGRFAAVPEALTRYRWHSGSLSRRHQMMKKLREAVLMEALNSERGRKISWNLRRRAISRVRSTSAWFVAEKDPSQAARWYAQSIISWPLEVNSWKGLIKSCLGRS